MIFSFSCDLFVMHQGRSVSSNRATRGRIVNKVKRMMAIFRQALFSKWRFFMKNVAIFQKKPILATLCPSSLTTAEPSGPEGDISFVHLEQSPISSCGLPCTLVQIEIVSFRKQKMSKLFKLAKVGQISYLLFMGHPNISFSDP